MNYRRIYLDFIKSRLGREIEPGTYIEVHHILPRSLGGSDDEDNLVKLTFREHLFAHQLLARIYKDTPHARKMWGALVALTQGATIISGLVKRGRGVVGKKIYTVLAKAKEEAVAANSGENAYMACGFRRYPAGHSNLKPATVPT